MKISKAFFILLFVSTNLWAQNVEIPSNVKFESADDYKKTEQLVLEATDWLLKTPISEEAKKRNEVNDFLMKWMGGSPSVSINLVPGIVPFDSPDCLMSFMSGWVKYSLQNNYSKDNVECAVAGAQNSIEFYIKNKAQLGKNSDMEKLVKQDKKGKLKSYIEQKF
ncbi:hypothetical protein [Flammeovirga sp. SJP92]|uniref:hypothetical protein n=1 Tax=Flammeovirga sp. SJP92 TaxID=1775430 RepID=UPI0012F92EEF|nr:hypothetical protein [Flammeovirga sp. SJP92]